MKHKNTIKSILYMLLIAAIIITGISLDETATAGAAAKFSNFVNGGTISMKPGSTKRFLVRVKYNAGDELSCEDYSWSSADKSIVSVGTDFVDPSVDYETEYLEVTAVNSGTATVTGKSKRYGYASITMTVTVTQSKSTTTASYKCSHSWKITTKATCQRAGIKTCKKCRLQKKIGKTSHKYVNTTVFTIERDGFYHEYYCTCFVYADGTPVDKDPDRGKNFDICNWGVKIKYDKYGNITPDSDFKSEDEAYSYLSSEHQSPKNPDWHYHYSWADAEIDINPHQVKKIVKKCKYCGIEKPSK
ncbi:MAG: Ig-like domain-containing protein [Lachnospiraceae bacterium]|nr:Ig-like domain-containing protein [Lachnospiraceae bacterium]